MGKGIGKVFVFTENKSVIMISGGWRETFVVRRGNIVVSGEKINRHAYKHNYIVDGRVDLEAE